MSLLSDFAIDPNKRQQRDDKPVASFNFYEVHSHNDIKQGLMKLPLADREKVIEVLENKRIWGSPAISQRILDAVQGELGEDTAKLIKDKVLTKYYKPGLTATQIKRNINLNRFSRAREEANEPGRNIEDEAPHYVNEPWRKHKAGINQDDDDDHFVSKRPLSFN